MPDKEDEDEWGKTVDELIQEIADCLAQWDGKDVVEVANSIMSKKHEYIGDDFVKEIEVK